MSRTKGLVIGEYLTLNYTASATPTSSTSTVVAVLQCRDPKGLEPLYEYWCSIINQYSSNLFNSVKGTYNYILKQNFTYRFMFRYPLRDWNADPDFQC